MCVFKLFDAEKMRSHFGHAKVALSGLDLHERVCIAARSARAYSLAQKRHAAGGPAGPTGCLCAMCALRLPLTLVTCVQCGQG